ncbi:MAG: hypothetical protein JW716_03475 [Candidatus Aenigmarchaeota archaeon]|nr:hypothetical protein [Candidatus Aenigmarchaeota archaeon]
MFVSGLISDSKKGREYNPQLNAGSAIFRTQRPIKTYSSGHFFDSYNWGRSGRIGSNVIGDDSYAKRTPDGRKVDISGSKEALNYLHEMHKKVNGEQGRMSLTMLPMQYFNGDRSKVSKGLGFSVNVENKDGSKEGVFVTPDGKIVHPDFPQKMDFRTFLEYSKAVGFGLGGILALKTADLIEKADSAWQGMKTSFKKTDFYNEVAEPVGRVCGDAVASIFLIPAAMYFDSRHKTKKTMTFVDEKPIYKRNIAFETERNMDYNDSVPPICLFPQIIRKQEKGREVDVNHLSDSINYLREMHLSKNGTTGYENADFRIESQPMIYLSGGKRKKGVGAVVTVRNKDNSQETIEIMPDGRIFPHNANFKTDTSTWYYSSKAISELNGKRKIKNYPDLRKGSRAIYWLFGCKPPQEISGFEAIRRLDEIESHRFDAAYPRLKRLSERYGNEQMNEIVGKVYRLCKTSEGVDVKHGLRDVRKSFGIKRRDMKSILQYTKYKSDWTETTPTIIPRNAESAVEDVALFNFLRYQKGGQMGVKSPDDLSLSHLLYIRRDLALNMTLVINNVQRIQKKPLTIRELLEEKRIPPKSPAYDPKGSRRSSLKLSTNNQG